MRDAPISAIVPARNEAATIGAVVDFLTRAPEVSEVIVVDNASTDDTARVARAAGARVIAEARLGMGHAFKAGVAVASHSWVMKLDADLARFGADLVTRLAAGRAPGVGLVKGAWRDAGDDMPMTRLLVAPAVAALCPPLAMLTAPNSGIYLMDRSLIAHDALRGDYAVDLDAMLRMGWAGHNVAEVDIGEIENDKRHPGHYSGMARQIMDFFLDCARIRVNEPMIVIGDALGPDADIIEDHARAGGLILWIGTVPDPLQCYPNVCEATAEEIETSAFPARPRIVGGTPAEARALGLRLGAGDLSSQKKIRSMRP